MHSDTKFINIICKPALFIILLFLVQHSFSQHPIYFSHNDENGLPSNEVYNLAQDQNGFIWIGSDAGLYKYNGIKYIRYTSDSQKSKSITGLTFSSSNTLYCYNFHSQIFLVENNTLKELVHPLKGVTNLANDHAGNLFVTHQKGISSYNEKSKKWFHYSIKGSIQTSTIAKSVRVNAKGEVYFVVKNGLGIIKNNQISLINHPIFENYEPGNFIIETWGDAVWIFIITNSTVFRLENNVIVPVSQSSLNKLLSNKKITNVKALKDNKLWICTYEGLIQYSSATAEAKHLYPQHSFSDGILDRENNYWFSTLQTGILRLPNTDFLVWNSKHPSIKNDKLTKIATDGKNVYFTSVNGYLGKINTYTNIIKNYYTDISADIQSLNYNTINKQLSFYQKGNQIFFVKDNHLTEKHIGVSAVKTFNHIENDYFIGSSSGLYYHSKNITSPIIKVSSSWVREVEYNRVTNEIWAATNNGLQSYIKKNGSWYINKIFFNKKQIISIFLDSSNQNLYTLSFDGEIHLISGNKKPIPIAKLDNNTQAYKLKYHQHKIYIATNKGLHSYHIRDKKWEIINKLSGISSDNVQDFCLLNGHIWLATGNGLNKIPTKIHINNSKAVIQLPPITVGGKTVSSSSNIQLRNKEFITLKPEASIYSSNGNFSYAYRIKNIDSQWIISPATAQQVEIKNVPSGSFEIELKAIDHLGRDSENKYTLLGHSHPPFWKNTWFITLALFLFLGVLYLSYKLRIHHITKLQLEEIERITLENKLQLSQETALRAQMNPHFIFNVLNSIKTYFYDNDKKNASIYLQKFADLIRQVLYHSARPTIKLAEEIELLNTYIQLEALLYPNEFSYNISTDSNIDTDFTTIPTFVIQPFVENAFKHGLRHKSGDKKLDISFQEEDNNIKVTITDNGVGRVASNLINKENKNIYPSFSTDAISQRIELLNKNHQQISVDIIDLEDEHKNSLGTSVILIFSKNE